VAKQNNNACILATNSHS